MRERVEKDKEKEGRKELLSLYKKGNCKERDEKGIEEVKRDEEIEKD